MIRDTSRTPAVSFPRSPRFAPIRISVEESPPDLRRRARAVVCKTTIGSSILPGSSDEDRRRLPNEADFAGHFQDTARHDQGWVVG
jgi:hypothetical protein